MYQTLIVVDNTASDLGDCFSSVISFETYLNEYPKHNESKTRIINLCNTQHYLSQGYYCSLLAEARKHNVLPSVKTINALRDESFDASSFLTNEIIAELDLTAIEQHTHYLFFGKFCNDRWPVLANRIFGKYPSPIVKVTFKTSETNIELQVEHGSISDLSTEQKAQFIEQLTYFTQSVWKKQSRPKSFRWDMAILVNPDEASPPSNKDAISRFVKAAAKFGICAEPVTIEQLTKQNVGYYDALFIRETTAIDHYTYRIACKAEAEGVVVIDDPTSILRCCNKVFLHDAFSYQKIASLKTSVINSCDSAAIAKLEIDFEYPMVLKMPEGSFSRGVFKVTNRAELTQRIQELLDESALVLVQEYLYTDFDWRIGVLNGRAIYACRYHMARNHWQIYNHNARRFNSGGFETLPTFEVPKAVLDSALKASAIIGKGLYGVDIKEANNKAYVIEVNDNPSIDYKVEDAYLGNELYMQIMDEFYRRLERRGRQ
ncbi:RimK family protein [Colwellia sp. MEBiC06753]